MNKSHTTNSTRTNFFNLLLIQFIAVTLLFGTIFAPLAAAQIRIAVLPFYSEEGREVKEGDYNTIHYRRMMGFIENQLVRHGFEVIDPFAKDSSEREYNRIMERARDDSPLACMELCKKYATDAVYIVWLKVKTEQTSDGYCKAAARVDGQGYDSAARSLGANVSKTFKVTKRDCDDAIAEVEKEVGDLVGRKLTAWSGGTGQTGSVVVSEKGTYSGVQELINVRLDGATEYELTEVFGKVINTVTGVVEAKRYSSRIAPDNPQACFMVWRLQIEGTDPFRIQANTMKMIHDILDSGGEIQLKGVPYRYSAAEVDLLKGIRPGDVSSRDIQFVVDRERARDSEFQERHDPYKARQEGGKKVGFE